MGIKSQKRPDHNHSSCLEKQPHRGPACRSPLVGVQRICTIGRVHDYLLLIIVLLQEQQRGTTHFRNILKNFHVQRAANRSTKILKATSSTTLHDHT